MSRFLNLFASLAFGIAASSVAAETKIAPSLGAATNLSQGIQRETFGLSRQLGITELRDGMQWPRVERTPGQYNFSDPRTGFPDKIAEIGAQVTLVMNWGNPIYDNGNTPQSPKALAAMGAFAAAVVDRFPAIDGIEVGNEFNGKNFVRGPIKQMKPLERARAYVAIVQAVSDAVRDTDPQMRILGGATHSLPGAYLWEIMDAGGAGYFDALAVHPYTTRAEHFVRQIDVIRRHPDLADMPIEVTEFGSPDQLRAASHMLRNYCQFGLGGVTRSVWFPGNLRGENMIPLFTPAGRVTSAGQAFRLINENMAGRDLKNASDDPFTYGCQFGDNVLVLWGAPRDVQTSGDVQVLTAEGAEITAPYALAEDAPLVFVSEQGDVATKLTLGAQRRVADSFHQFHYPEDGAEDLSGDGFVRLALKRRKEIALQTMPGQERPGVPWYPYLGHEDHGRIRVTPENLLPGRNLDIVHRYTSPTDQNVVLTAQFTPSDRSEDGISVRISINGDDIFSGDAAASQELVFAQKQITLTTGDVLDVAVSANGTAKGDVTQYRLTLDKN